MLTGYTSLRKLILDNNGLQDSDIIAFCNVLPTLEIRELNLGFNQISLNGFSPLFRFLCSQACCIEVLTLSGNALSVEACNSLADSISKNNSLTSLFLDHSNIGFDGSKLLISAFISNLFSRLTQITGIDIFSVLPVTVPNFDQLKYQLVDESNESCIRLIKYFKECQNNELRCNSLQNGVEYRSNCCFANSSIGETSFDRFSFLKLRQSDLQLSNLSISSRNNDLKSQGYFSKNSFAMLDDEFVSENRWSMLKREHPHIAVSVYIYNIYISLLRSLNCF